MAWKITYTHLINVMNIKRNSVKYLDSDNTENRKNEGFLLCQVLKFIAKTLHKVNAHSLL